MTETTKPDLDPVVAIAGLVEALRSAILGLTELFGTVLAIQAQLEKDATGAISH
jgi:hypothetical protein